MAGKIQWAIEFKGLDLALAKLKEIDRTLQSISRHKGTTFLGQPGQPGVPGRNVVVPPAAGGGAGSAAGAAGAAALGAKAATDPLKEATDKYLKQVQKLEEQGYVSRLRAGQAVPLASLPENMRRMLEKTGMRIRIPGVGAGIPGIGHGAYPLPPVIPPPIPKPSAFSDILGGLKTSLKDFHLGFKELGHAFNVGGISRMGRAIALFGRAGVAAAGVAVALLALHEAIKMLIKGIEIGSRAYQEAAALAGKTAKTAQIEMALRSIGIQERPTFQMLQAGSTQGVIGAAAASGFGSAQQLRNMAKEFEQAMKEANFSSRELAQSAKANQMLAMDMSNIQREWHTLLAQFSAAMQPIVHNILEGVKNLLKAINLYLAIINWIKTQLGKIPGVGGLLGGIPSGEPGTMKIPTGAGGAGAITGMEKIGFVFGVGGPTEELKKVSKNTKESSQKLGDIYEVLKIIAKVNPMTMGGAQFLP